MKRLRSVCVPTAVSSIGAQKLGQPVPLSYLASASKSALPQPAQRKVPGRFSPLSGEEPGRSVPCSRSTRNCSGESRRRHSASGFSTS